MRFLLDNPLVAAFALLLLLIVSAVPVGMWQRRRSKNCGFHPPPAESRFMGASYDVLLVAFGVLLVLVIAGVVIGLLL